MALYSAVFYGIENIARLLLEKGVKLNVKGKDADTAMELTAQNGHNTVLKLLFERASELLKFFLLYSQLPMVIG